MRRKRFSERVRAEVLLRYGGKCAICGHEIKHGRQFDLDHIVPLALGGSDEIDNLQPVHKSCHREKTKADVKAIRKVHRLKHGRRKKPWLWSR